MNIVAVRDVEKRKPSIATFVKASDAGEDTHHWASLSATAEDVVP